MTSGAHVEIPWHEKFSISEVCERDEIDSVVLEAVATINRVYQDSI